MKFDNVFSYPYPHPALTADCAVFGFDGREVKILLIERGLEPYKGYWALPGGFMRMDETIEDCARRELSEETNLHPSWLSQMGVYSNVKRDPRERVVTVAFVALIPSHEVVPVAGDDACATAWFALDELPPLAFDHQAIVSDATAFLKRQLQVGRVASKMLNDTFTLSQLRLLMEWATGEKQDRRNFERKFLDSGMIEEVPTCIYRPVPPKSQEKPTRKPKRWFSFRSLFIEDDDIDD